MKISNYSNIRKMKINCKHFLFLLVPHSALFQNTKYQVSNITKTLILASSPFIDHTGLPVQYGSPVDLSGDQEDQEKQEQEQEEQEEDVSLPQASRIHEVRVLAPTVSGSKRKPKSFYNPYFEYENQRTR